MADWENVVYGLKCIIGKLDPVPAVTCPTCHYTTGSGEFDDCVRAIAEDALELLKEQEPIKPTVSVDTWICSKCGHTLESQELIDDKENPQVLIHEQYNYCPNCGRKVKWDE